MERLFAVFRDKGFEGASLADLSRATGLGRSSLYHHFPAGKEQMAEAVLARALAVIDEAIVGAAASPGPLKPRLRRIVATLTEMYGGGRTPCVLAQLATAGVGEGARTLLRRAFEHWVDAIMRLAAESGLPAIEARHFAEDWVARLQGCLIWQAASGDAGPFDRALDTLLALGEPSRSQLT